MKRKIIQIVDRFIGREDEAVLVALAEDGTVWEYCNTVTNQDAISAAYAKRKELGCAAWPIPKYLYEMRWERVPGLPDDNSNLWKEHD